MKYRIVEVGSRGRSTVYLVEKLSRPWWQLGSGDPQWRLVQGFHYFKDAELFMSKIQGPRQERRILAEYDL